MYTEKPFFTSPFPEISSTKIDRPTAQDENLLSPAFLLFNYDAKARVRINQGESGSEKVGESKTTKTLDMRTHGRRGHQVDQKSSSYLQEMKDLFFPW